MDNYLYKYNKYKTKYMLAKKMVGGVTGYNYIYKKYKGITNDQIYDDFLTKFYLSALDEINSLPILSGVDPDKYDFQQINPIESDELKQLIKKAHFLKMVLLNGNLEMFIRANNQFEGMSIINIWKTLPIMYKNVYDFAKISKIEEFYDISDYCDHEYKNETSEIYSRSDLKKNKIIDDKIIIGRGFEVDVYIKKDNPRDIFKIYKTTNIHHLAITQINIQTEIQSVITEILPYVKIPKLLHHDVDGDTITLIFERIYNYNDTDVNHPDQMLNVIITNSSENPLQIAGRGKFVTLNAIETILGKDLLIIYIEQLGKMFGLLNFKARMKTDDIEIVFGKDNIDDTIYKFYILDFDRVTKVTYNPTTEQKFPSYDYNFLGRKDYFEFSTLNIEYKRAFERGYLDIATQYGKTNIANNVLKNIK